MIERRKEDHIRISLEKEVEIKTDYWKMIHFSHKAAPEVDMDEISLETEFLGHRLSAPFIISAITGGYHGAKEFNHRLSAAAEKAGIAFGVGSQRPALEHKELRASYEVIKKNKPPMVMANLGAPQVIDQKGKHIFTVEDGREAMDMIGAKCLAIHFNYLQEVVQPEGDLRAMGVLEALSDFCDELPIVAKETGAGVDSETASRFLNAGVKAIDVGGMGGTSFSAVEYYREGANKSLAKELWDWGIPTPVSILECRRTVDLPLISTGGVRNGLDAAKAIALGANIAGVAGGILPPASQSLDNTIEYLEDMKKELKTVMFLLGCEKVEDLRDQRVIITDTLKDWII
ncbi:MAG: type 2 isopentenyl-diphosphate Delta-isomerase [Thermoplasmata archaeon]